MQEEPRISDGRWRRVVAIAFACGLALVALAASGVFSPAGPATDVVQRQASPMIMGTTCRLIAVGQEHLVEMAFAAGIRELEAVDKAMSTYKADSEVSRFNAAAVGTEVSLSLPTLTVLRTAQALAQQTQGAFDVTMKPLETLWAQAEANDEWPTQDALRATLAKVGPTTIVLEESTARKTVPGVAVSLDAIAKGYGIDRALEAMRRVGLQGGLVDVGGDLSCFGRPLDSEQWQIGVQSPWTDQEHIAILSPDRDDRNFAVCTSGNYRRYFTIKDRQYSHILDPRTGHPADAWSSVTVIAADAMTADGWATALSVLGPQQGLLVLRDQPDIEVLFVTGLPDLPEVRTSAGLRRFVRSSDARLKLD